jgi:hypothetical protein
VCCRREGEEYRRIEEVYREMKEKGKGGSLEVNEMKAEDYAQRIVEEMNPKLTLSLLPESSYKTVVGLIEPELLRDAAQKWKKKFKESYKH